MTITKAVPSPGFLSQPAWDRLVGGLGVSGREAEIVALILAGRNEAAMADELGISHHTVHTYLERLHRKLDVSGRCELVVRVFAAYVAQTATDGPPADTGLAAARRPLRARRGAMGP